MEYNKLFTYICFTLLCSCSESGPSPTSPPQEIQGRDHEGKRFNVYRAKVPDEWIRRDSFAGESLSDTKKPICEFLISEGDQFIRITIHNFPSNTMEERIPSIAQIARWKKQFEILVSEESGVIPQAFNGYNGLKFKGIGKFNENNRMVLGWSLQMGKEHYRTLSNPSNPQQSALYQEMRADVTIKAVGPIELMESHENEINTFARSFELIEEIPSYR
jgi:hypothetical protein